MNRSILHYNFIIFSIIILIKKIHFIQSNLNCQINITIKGKGDQYILFEKDLLIIDGKFQKTISYYPDQIYVNDILQDYKGKKVFNLIDGINNVSLIFNTKLLYMTAMFADLNNIISIDFSNCDTSMVTDMEFAFANCRSLVSLNLDNFNSSLVNNMYCTFCNCSSLQFLDLDYFDTSRVTIMREMFLGCTSLISLPNISKWNIDNLININTMFSGCKDSLNIPKKFEEF